MRQVAGSAPETEEFKNTISHCLLFLTKTQHDFIVVSYRFVICAGLNYKDSKHNEEMCYVEEYQHD